MSRLRRRRRLILLVAAALAAALLGAGVHAADALRRLELQSIDQRFDLRGPRTPPDDIVVVGIDATTFQQTNRRWPFSRTVHARVVDKLRRAGARLVVYDVEFTGRTSPAADGALLEAVYDARGRVVLAATEVDPGGTANVLGGPATQREVGARVGSAVVPVDSGGVVRRMTASHDGLASLPVVVGRALGRPPDLRRFGEGGAWIDFHGPPRTLHYRSLSDVLFAEPAQLGDVRGKIVVVGAVAPSLQDVRGTPTSGDGLMSGPEIQAEAIATVLDDFPLRATPAWAGLLLVLLAAAVPPLLSRRLRPVTAFLAALGLGALYAVGAQAAFAAGRVVPLVEPLFVLGVSAVTTLAALYVLEALERRRVRDAFSHYVPPDVVDQILDTAEDGLRLGGTRRECTALFADLRGFTSFAESRPPDLVIDVLNEWLGEMTEAVLENGGTLVTFLGDGLFALFGAPLDQPDHRDRAVATARDMLRRLEALNTRMLAAGRAAEPFRIGIGVNTGPVMTGNLGSVRRMEYTAIGDAVNTASRLESMTKGSAFAAFVAESTRAGLSTPHDDLVFADELEVRGRRARIALWGLPDVTAPDAGRVLDEEPEEQAIPR